MPDDPFSAQYRAAVLEVWRKITGRSVYEASICELSAINVEKRIAKPDIYTGNSEFLGSYLESYGHIIRQIKASPGARTLEYGCGDGQISLHLARMGCDVTVIDIEPAYIEIINAQAAKLGVPIKAVQGGFLDGAELDKFDRIFFYQSFHHSLEHQDALDHLRILLKDDGLLVFGAEPIVDPHGPWRYAVPYPWGPRLDGLSLRAMRTHGWMELGFHDSYFLELLDRHGWSLVSREESGLLFSWVCAKEPLSAGELRSRLNTSAQDRARMSAERDAAVAERDRLAAERDAAQAEIAALRRSTSWSITAPLRALSSIVRPR